jgi:hypothetical protein
VSSAASEVAGTDLQNCVSGEIRTSGEEIGTGQHLGIRPGGRDNNKDGKQQSEQQDQNSGNGDDEMGWNQEENHIGFLPTENRAQECTR